MHMAVGEGGVEVRVREGGRAVLPCRPATGGSATAGVGGSGAGSSGLSAPMWRHHGQPLPQDPRYHTDRTSLVITRTRPSDSGQWLCSPHSSPVHLVVLESPKSPYLLIDSRRLDPGNLFVPVKENSRLSVECVVEGGAPAPGLHWLLVPPPGAASPPGLSQQEGSPATPTAPPSPQHAPQHGFTASTATIPRVLRAHHNSTVACIVTHPTLPAPLNASILLDVQL